MANLAYPRFKGFDPNTGAFLAGGKLYAYAAGTSNAQNTYTDESLGTANANPVILDGSGEADVWLDPALSYKLVLADAYDTVIWTVDDIQATEAGRFAAISASGQITSTAATGTAPFVIASTTKVSNLNVDQLDGGDWAAPGAAIGSGTRVPSTSQFTNVDASGTLNADGAATVGGALSVTGATALTGALTENADGTMQTANGAKVIRGSISEEITLSTAGTTTDSSANLLPANCIIEAVAARVTASITTATDWKLGDATQAARFCAAQSGAQLNVGATVVGLAHRDPTVASADLGPVQSSAAALRVTTTGTPGAGKIRVTVYYLQFVAPTS